MKRCKELRKPVILIYSEVDKIKSFTLKFYWKFIQIVLNVAITKLLVFVKQNISLSHNGGPRPPPRRRRLVATRNPIFCDFFHPDARNTPKRPPETARLTRATCPWIHSQSCQVYACLISVKSRNDMLLFGECYEPLLVAVQLALLSSQPST